MELQHLDYSNIIVNKSTRIQCTIKMRFQNNRKKYFSLRLSCVTNNVFVIQEQTRFILDTRRISILLSQFISYNSNI